MMRFENYWYSQNPVAWLLLPVSWLFCAAAMLRRLCYQLGLLKSVRLSVPVIIVGNISVGGTGKTPLLVALCELLKEKGARVGIVSRGYGGNFSGEKIISSKDTAFDVGDEPYLLKHRTGLPVVVGINRPAAVQYLLEKHACDIVLSDDGMQHYRLQRDLEIAVIDASRSFGNGFCLPAGPLRERPGRLDDVGIIAYHTTADYDQTQVCSFSLEFGDVINLLSGQSRPVSGFAGGPVHAVAGIGHPPRFFNQLRAGGLDIIEHSFSDHHAYTAADIAFADSKPVVMTEKDAVKCRAFASENHWYIPVTAKLSAELEHRITTKISQLLNAKVDR